MIASGRYASNWNAVKIVFKIPLFVGQILENFWTEFSKYSTLLVSVAGLSKSHESIKLLIRLSHPWNPHYDPVWKLSIHYSNKDKGLSLGRDVFQIGAISSYYGGIVGMVKRFLSKSLSMFF